MGITFCGAGAATAHMNAGLGPERLAAEARAWFGGEVVVAEDGLVLTE